MTQTPDEVSRLQAKSGAGNDQASTDEKLIREFLDGNQDAFMRLVQRHQERVRNLIFSILGYSQVVDDLAQDVFIKAFQSLPAFRHQSSFSTWLYRITVNRCRDEIRRSKVRKMFRLETLAEHDHPAETESSDRTERILLDEALKNALQQLSESHRTIVLLKEVEGLSYEEISVVLRCGVGTVKSRLARARVRLKKLLQPYVEEEA